MDVELKWRGIQLLPAIPLDGIPYKAFYLQRLGTSMAVKRRQEQVRQAAKGVGVDIDFERIPRMPNTAKAHSLFLNVMKFSKPEDVNLLIEGLFSAYFHHSENISDPAVLQKIAVYCGFDEGKIKQILADPQTPFISANTGGKGVPYFVIDGSFALAGAHAASTLYDAMLDALELQRQVAV